MSKIKTIDEYFLGKLECAETTAKESKELVDTLLAKINELEQKPKEEMIEKVVESRFKCYIISTTSSYSIDGKINDKYNNLEFMKKCLEDDETIKVFLDKKSWKKTNYGDYFPSIREQLYNYEINFYGTIVGVYIFYYDNSVKSTAYVVNNITTCESMEKAQEQLVVKQREEIKDYIKYTLEKDKGK